MIKKFLASKIIKIKKFKLNLRNGKDNQKILFIVLHHIFSILTDENSIFIFKVCFPPRTQSDIIEFKNISMSLFEKLEKEGKVINI